MSISEATWFRRSVLTGAAVIILALLAVPAIHLFGRGGSGDTSRRPSADSASAFLADLERNDIPDDENAARWLEAGAGAIVWSDEDMACIGEASGTPYREWPESLRQQARETLERHAGALATLHNATGHERSSYGITYAEGYSAELPDLLELLRAGRLLVVEARVAFADGNGQRGLTALATTSRLVTSLEAESTLITALVGIAAERMMVFAATEAAASEDSRLVDLLGEIGACVAGADHAEMLRRVAAAWEAVGKVAIADGVHVLDDGPRGTTELPEDLRGEDLARARAAIAGLVEVPYGAATERFEALESLLGPPDEGLGADLGGFAKAVGRAQSVQAQRQLLHAAIELRRLARESGAYPEIRPQIHELTEPDPFTGRPISYEVVADGSVTLTLDGAAELLAQVALPSMAEKLVPVTLPPPS